jgi:hypothetical protein
MKNYFFPLLLLLVTCQTPKVSNEIHTDTGRPWTRWWWFAGEIQEAQIDRDLKWLKANHFGGVEVAWIYPYNRLDTVATPRQEWLSPEWSEKVRYAKLKADSLGLGFDVTFGTLWPFGDTQVPREEATMLLNDSSFRQVLRLHWEHPRKGLVIDHLKEQALRNYAERMGKALKPALQSGTQSGIFVDSWEVEQRYLGTTGFMEEFRAKYGYGLELYLDSLYVPRPPYQQVLYDYQRLVSELVIDQFYRPFTAIAHELGAYSRAQCAGAPCDILQAYASVDVPESEALLYEPYYSNIPAAAAAWTGRPKVTAEAFTCLYGWPADWMKREQTADLKLLADALFANGVNQIIWHGRAMGRTEQDTFFATVHLGPSGKLARELPAFNQYLTKVSKALQRGHTYSKVAVYLPLEDQWIKGEMPKEQQYIWAWSHNEHRYLKLPQSLQRYHPLWINAELLNEATLKNGKLQSGQTEVEALYVEANYLDTASLRAIIRAAESGLKVVMPQVPQPPGLKTDTSGYQRLVTTLMQLPAVHRSWESLSAGIAPVVTGTDLPEYWCRESEAGLTCFFAHPKTESVSFPMGYGQSFTENAVSRTVQIHYNGHEALVQLDFQPYQSILLQVDAHGAVTFEDITFIPETPKVEARPEKEKERWEVEYTDD